MTAADGAQAILVGGSVGGLGAAAGWAAFRRRRSGTGLTGRTALARASSYALLGLALAVAAELGTAGIAALVLVFGALGLHEWCRITGLPLHHRVALQIANVAIVVAVALAGVRVVDGLVIGLVLVGLSWPVLRADTGRAIRDLGFAAVGCVALPAMLAHGVLLAVDRGELGLALFVGLAVACAASDVAAYVVGRRFGRTPLAPMLSPGKTREGVTGNAVGAAVGLAPFAPLLVPALGWPALGGLVVLVTIGAVWGDLFESAVKREAGVKDAGAWLPGFGGILDRIDSLLITLPLVYWCLRLTLPAAGAVPG